MQDRWGSNQNSSSGGGGSGPHSRSNQSNLVAHTNSQGNTVWIPEQNEEKSVTLAAILGGLFGGIGLLYVTSFGWAILVALICGFFAVITGGVSMLATTIICGIAGAYFAVEHNETVRRNLQMKEKLASSQPQFKGFNSGQQSPSSSLFGVNPDGNATTVCCGVSYGSYDKFCGRCGKSLVAKIETCCGVPLASEARYCSQCGKPQARRAA